jgi:hypothetical protein
MSGMAANTPPGEQAYEPGGRYEPAGPSVRGFALLIVGMTIVWISREYLERAFGAGAPRLLTDGIWLAFAISMLIRAYRRRFDPGQRRAEAVIFVLLFLYAVVRLFVDFNAFMFPE